MNPTLHSSHQRLGLALVAFVSLMLCVLAKADDKPIGLLVFNLNVPGSSLTVKNVHEVVLHASIARGWMVKEDADSKVIIYLNHRKNEATVTYLISEKSVAAYCEGFATDGNGTRKGPELPTGWLNNLKGDITKGLVTASTLKH